MQPYHLLHKTELKIERITLRGANLTELAAVVADTLSLEREKVLVIDVRDDTVALDILQERVDADSIVGKQDLLLRRLSALPGVGITAQTRCSSDGMLGWIAWDEAEGRQALRHSEKIAAAVRRTLSRRAIVFSTGAEVVAGRIQDTNTPAIARRLEAEGYSVTRGATLGDDVDLIFAYLRTAVEDDGYGLVITTGGTGAEDKDCTVEAIQAVDPDAATPVRQARLGGDDCRDPPRLAARAIEPAIPRPSCAARLRRGASRTTRAKHSATVKAAIRRPRRVGEHQDVRAISTSLLTHADWLHDRAQPYRHERTCHGARPGFCAQ
ncbi:MAG: putative molybdopterin binding domain protein [Deltaproteobacteria bacterium]|nr:putative molybdopterin binding domain protein [Deltaproteobacteria bacterium]